MVDDTVRGKRLAHAVSEAVAHAAAARGEKPVETIRWLSKALSVSAKTATRWTTGESVPDALALAPLASLLGVSPMLFVDPPPVPDYPLSEYLVRKATGEGTEEGIRRARPRQRRAAAGGSGQ